MSKKGTSSQFGLTSVSANTSRILFSIVRKIQLYVICRELTTGSILISMSGILSKQNQILLLGGGFTRTSIRPCSRWSEPASTRSTVLTLKRWPRSSLATALMTIFTPPVYLTSIDKIISPEMLMSLSRGLLSMGPASPRSILCTFT